jgi:hypothetical protein
MDMQPGAMDMHHRLGHAAWTWISSTNMDMQHGQAVQTISMDIQHVVCCVVFSQPDNKSGMLYGTKTKICVKRAIRRLPV